MGLFSSKATKGRVNAKRKPAGASTGGQFAKDSSGAKNIPTVNSQKEPVSPAFHAIQSDTVIVKPGQARTVAEVYTGKDLIEIFQEHGSLQANPLSIMQSRNFLEHQERENTKIS